MASSQNLLTFSIAIVLFSCLIGFIYYLAMKNSKCSNNEMEMPETTSVYHEVDRNSERIEFMDAETDFIDEKKLKDIARDGEKRPVYIPGFAGEELQPIKNFNMKYFSTRVDDEYIVRCWEIPCLIGRIIKVEDEGMLDFAMCKEIEKLGVRIAMPMTTLGPFRKYRIVHHSFTTDKKSQYDTPMFIELYGSANLDRKESNKALDDMHILDGKVIGAITVNIIQATWSNISYPGINVPFYE